MGKRRKPVRGHRCRGCQETFQVRCECGWRSRHYDTRTEAYREWREHMIPHEAPLLAALLNYQAVETSNDESS